MGILGGGARLGGVSASEMLEKEISERLLELRDKPEFSENGEFDHKPSDLIAERLKKSDALLDEIDAMQAPERYREGLLVFHEHQSVETELQSQLSALVREALSDATNQNKGTLERIRELEAKERRIREDMMKSLRKFTAVRSAGRKV